MKSQGVMLHGILFNLHDVLLEKVKLQVSGCQGKEEALTVKEQHKGILEAYGILCVDCSQN